MSRLKHVFDGTTENFQQLVLENSSKVLVLVNFWAPKADPCFKLWRALEGLSEEYQGRFLLVNVNTESQPGLVRESGITSVPTLKLFSKGAVVESIHGAQSEQSLRNVIDKYLPPPPGSTITAALQAYQAGDPDEALRLLAAASRNNPRDMNLHTMTIKLLFREHRFEDVTRYFSSLPEEARRNADLKHLSIHAGILQLAEQAPPAEELDQQLRVHPDDQETLLSRASLALVQDDHEYALECLLHAFQQDRNHRDGFAQQAMLSLFSLLGSGHELTRTFQQRMRDTLH
ncbi:MAG: tetratricopeptide repeat protein [Gammaproteobacteria bacterium]|nr:tetratricopeptide repeat protein [Gammaproteobacteria bacterium]MCW9059151.1 tetratricopeptide repeat protein [Gammaproteobacteria bacterium]